MSSTIGILAYGSLIDEPGNEIGPLIVNRIACQTPFPIEYARSSRSRDGAPTLVPVEQNGARVNAVILVLADGTSLALGKNILWRREVRQKDKSRIYRELPNPRPDTVQVKVIEDFEGIDQVIYTQIGQNISPLIPQVLAAQAIQSILSPAGELGLDGVRYLSLAQKNGIVTPLSGPYEAEILKQTNTKSLAEAIELLDEERPEWLSNASDWEAFENQIKEIADLIGEFGLNKTLEIHPIGDTPIEEYHKQHYKLFTANVHEGWKLAQKKILAHLLLLEKETDDLKEKVKTAKSAKEKRALRNQKLQLKAVEIKERMLRHLIDTIAWSMIGGQLYIARRLFQGTDGEKRLMKTNIGSVMAAADKYNENDADFALITDLSAYVQTGDLLVIKAGKGLEIVEVKEGDVNHRILNVLDDLMAKDKTMEEAFGELKDDPKALEQLERNLKQYKKTMSTLEILKNDKGEDDKGRQVNIITPEEETPMFDDRLAAMYEKLQENGMWAYENIDGCLHIGMYQGHFRDGGHIILEGLAKQHGGPYFIVDYVSIMKSLHKPLFVAPFLREFIFDLLFQRVKLYFVVEVEPFMALFNRYGMRAEWMRRSETTRLKEEYQLDELFLVDNRGIKVTHDETQQVSYLQSGIFNKLYFEHIYPDYVAYSQLYNFRNASENKQNDK
ncbi:MAG: hypothetical protein V4592_05515 [Bacteroidota bacterium]